MTEGCLSKRYRLYTLKVLQNTCMEIQKNCHPVSSIEKIATKTKDFMSNIIPLLKTDNSDQIITEYTSELIFAVLNSASALIYHFFKEIKQNYMREEFFDLGENTLICWTKILQLMCSNESDSTPLAQTLYYDMLEA